MTESQAEAAASDGPKARLLNKITVAYDLTQDRISLSGRTDSDETVQVWLTLRLLTRLVPHLVGSPQTQQLMASAELETTGTGTPQSKGTGTAKEKAKDAASDHESAQEDYSDDTPVQLQSNSDVFLAGAVDVSARSDLLVLTFRDVANKHAVRFGLPGDALSTWLKGLRYCYRQGEWPMHAWDGFEEAIATIQTATLTLH